MSYYDDPKSVQDYIRMCKDYDGTQIYNVLNRHLKTGQTVLELGSGPGFDLAFLKLNFMVTGSDLSDVFIDHCRKRFPETPILKLNAISIDIDDQFEAIFSNKVLHHLPPKDLEQSFGRQQQVLQHNGIFAHTFWLGDKQEEMHGLKFFYHNRDKLIMKIEKYFEIVEVMDYAEFEEGDSILVVAKNSIEK